MVLITKNPAVLSKNIAGRKMSVFSTICFSAEANFEELHQSRIKNLFLQKLESSFIINFLKSTKKKNRL